MSLAKKKRDLERMLRRRQQSDDNDEKSIATSQILEKKILEIEKQMNVKSQTQKVRKNAIKYRMLRFVERKKIVRRIRQLNMKIDSILNHDSNDDDDDNDDDNDGDNNGKKMEDKKKKNGKDNKKNDFALLEMKKERIKLLDDLEYVMYYPNEFKYISLLTESQENEKGRRLSASERQKLQHKICMKAKELRNADLIAGNRDKVEAALAEIASTDLVENDREVWAKVKSVEFHDSYDESYYKGDFDFDDDHKKAEEDGIICRNKNQNKAKKLATTSNNLRVISATSKNNDKEEPKHNDIDEDNQSFNNNKDNIDPFFIEEAGDVDYSALKFDIASEHKPFNNNGYNNHRSFLPTKFQNIKKGEYGGIRHGYGGGSGGRGNPNFKRTKQEERMFKWKQQKRERQMGNGQGQGQGQRSFE